MILRKIFPFILLVIAFSCNSNTVTNSDDYKAYLTTTMDKDKLMSEAQFLTDKIEATPNQFTHLAIRASAYTKIFNTTGDISYLIKAEDDLIEVIDITGRKFPSYLKSLASNYISQHRFKEALVLLKEAEENGEKLNGTKKMLFDVHLELGNYLYAETYLKDIKNNSDFDYLIRLSKWKDHGGDLEGAIIEMEKATAIAESSNISETKQWAYTNLADFYGHAGRVEESYNLYLKALQLDPNDAYAKKGIAWIAYSYENNPKEALKILNHISSYYDAPDYYLLKAEIAEFLNDKNLKANSMKNYQTSVANAQYGDMYNKYNIMIFTEELLLPERAIEIAKIEVNNRPTPQSYDLLAWSYFKNGNVEKANSIIEKYVDGQTSEPEVLYHIAEIYKAVGKTGKIKALKDELIASIYELGPTMKQKINQL
ncbi:cell surface protein [Winogradskyella echinorum]|uniref:Cell surface protein n=1 Tax=Winogradskyella echinorum TaxID=538189 RepID=A0ABR6Y367_9FLAO|nr:tetratricopeptide repeat protein [Winogradskyella echinorum]MBC3847194.1 cell surface protein [Winogradskyella echinorum]MBC5751542.1 cell surface protein [Winogradskyella echinorum]